MTNLGLENIKKEIINYINPADIKLQSSDDDAPINALWKDNPRLKQAPDASFIQSIKDYGILTPLQIAVNVTKSGAKEIILVAGSRRLAAAIEIVKSGGKFAEFKVPVVLRDLSHSEILDAHMIENHQRMDNSPSTIAFEAYAAVVLGKRSYEDVAAAMGVSHQTVRNWVATHTMPVAVRKALDAGRISPTVAFGLNTKAFKKEDGKTWDNEKLTSALSAAVESAKLRGDGRVSVADSKKAANRVKNPDAIIPPSKDELRRIAMLPSTPEWAAVLLQFVTGDFSLERAQNEGGLDWLMIPAKPAKVKAEKTEKKAGAKKSKKAPAAPVAEEEVTVDDGDIDDLFGEDSED